MVASHSTSQRNRLVFCFLRFNLKKMSKLIFIPATFVGILLTNSSVGFRNGDRVTIAAGT